MNYLVSFKISLEGESFPTLVTTVRLLSSVHCLVVYEVTCLREGFPTLPTTMTLLSSVNSKVYVEGAH